MTTSTPGDSRKPGTSKGPGTDKSSSPFGVPLPPDLRAGPVVVGVDSVDTCSRPLRAAVFLARSLGRPVTAVHVRHDTGPHAAEYVRIPEDVELDGSAEDALETALFADLRDSGQMTNVSWEFVSTSGDAAVELIRIADECDAACLVVGKRHRGFSRFLHHIAIGSVSRALVSSQKFPVLVVP